jgi:hypothetical protein
MTTKTNHWFKALFALGAVVFMAGRVGAEELHQPVAHSPAVIELSDQFDTTQRLTFPTTNITILTIADKDASDQVDGWVDALVGRYMGRADLRGMADTSGIPGFLHGLVRSEIRKTRKYPVMLDWSGKVSAELNFQPGDANVLILDRDGTILGHIIGAAVETNRTAVYTLVDQALAGRSNRNASAATAADDQANDLPKPLWRLFSPCFCLVR